MDQAYSTGAEDQTVVKHVPRAVRSLSVRPQRPNMRFRKMIPWVAPGLFTSFRRWGSPEFIGLGFLSFITIIITELFGSPFLKNASIIVGLAVGCIVAGAAGYIDGSTITSAPAITFLWYVHCSLSH